MFPGFIRRLAGALGVGQRPRSADAGERPYVRRAGRYTTLQFNRRDAQSRMLTAQPDRLLVDYTRTMMGVLLFQPAPRRLGMIGLGGGSQVKFCHRHLPQSRVEVAEISADVIALRDAFRVPADDARLAVHLEDGARFVRERPGCFDVLLVDGYDASGIAPSLASPAFYDDCRRALAADGVLAVNLYGPGTPRHLDWIRDGFADAMLVLVEPKMSNAVVFAWRGDAALRLPIGPGGTIRCPDALAAAAGAELLPVFERIGNALYRARGADAAESAATDGDPVR
jgi:spermidine synthase